MPFDPKAYIAKKKSQAAGFDPKAYLAKKAEEQIADAMQGQDTIRQGTWAETSPTLNKLSSYLGGLKAGIPYDTQLSGLLGMLRGKTYTEGRDTAQLQHEVDEFNNPKTYLAGNITSGVATAALPELAAAKALGLASGAGKAANLVSKVPGMGPALEAIGSVPGVQQFSKLPEIAKQGIIGAHYGASKSDVDLTKENPDLLKYGMDIAKPAAIGAGSAATIPLVAKGIKGALGDSDYGKVFAKSYDTGVNLSNKKTLEKLVNAEKIEPANDIVNKLIEDAKQNAISKNKILQKYGKEPVDLSDIRKQVEQEVENLPTSLEHEKKLVADVKKGIKEAFLDKSKIEDVVTGTKVKEVPYSASTQDKLNEQIADLRLKDEALGVNSRYSVEPVENELGQKRLKLMRYTDDVPTSAPEKIVPIRNEKGEVIDTALSSENPSISNKAEVLGIHPDVPASGGYKQFSPIKSTQEVPSVRTGPYTTEEADLIRENLTTLMGKNERPNPSGFGPTNKEKTYSPLSSARGAVSEKIGGVSPEIADINEQIRRRAELGETLGLNQMKETTLNEVTPETTTIDKLPLNQKLKATAPIRSYADPETAGVEAATSRMSQQQAIKEALNQYDPSLAEKFGRMVQSSSDISAGEGIQTQLGQLSHKSGVMRAAAGAAAGIGGKVLRGTNKAINTITPPAIATALSPKFSDMTDDEKIILAKQLRNRNNAGVAAKVEKAIASKNPLDHSQADFVLGQTGGINKMTNEINEDDEEE